MLRLFDLQLQVEELKFALCSSEQREAIKLVHKETVDEDGEVALEQYFRSLRRQAGAEVGKASDRPDTSLADPWAELRHADRQEADSEFLDREWKQFWETL